MECWHEKYELCYLAVKASKCAMSLLALGDLHLEFLYGRLESTSLTDMCPANTCAADMCTVNTSTVTVSTMNITKSEQVSLVVAIEQQSLTLQSLEVGAREYEQIIIDVQTAGSTVIQV